MPGRRTVPFLHAQRTKRGTAYHWKPSPRLRELGWKNIYLGDELEPAIVAALAQNRRVADKGVMPPAACTPDAKAVRKETLQRRLAALARLAERMEDELKRLGGRSRVKVYFISTPNGPIKIGVSTNPRARLRSLQTSQSKKLRLLAETDGGHALESEYHRRFAAHKIRGEWFAPHREILDEIRRLSSASGRESSHSPSHRRMARP